MVLLMDFFWLFEGANPGLARLEDCGSTSAHLKTKKMVAEEYAARHLLRIQLALEEGDLGGAYWLPGAGNLADGLTEARGDMAPFWRPLGSGRLKPGVFTTS